MREDKKVHAKHYSIYACFLYDVFLWGDFFSSIVGLFQLTPQSCIILFES